MSGPIVFRSKAHLIDAVLGGLWDYPLKSNAPVDLVHLWASGVEEDQSRAPDQSTDSGLSGLREAHTEACDAADVILARITAEIGRYIIEATDEDMVPLMQEAGVVLTGKMIRRLYEATDTSALAAHHAGEKVSAPDPTGLSGLREGGLALVRKLVDAWDKTAPYVDAVVLTQHARTGIGFEGPEDFAEALAEARQALSTNPATEEGKVSAPSQGEWLPIETAPKDGTEILVWTGRFARVARFVRDCGWMAVGGRQVYARPILHWRPLPDAPNTTGKAPEAAREGGQ